MGFDDHKGLRTYRTYGTEHGRSAASSINCPHRDPTTGQSIRSKCELCLFRQRHGHEGTAVSLLPRLAYYRGEVMVEG